MIKTSRRHWLTGYVVFLVLAATVCNAERQDEIRMVELASLPMPVSNNAVTVVTVGQRQFVVSFMGIGSGKTFRDTLSDTTVLDTTSGQWRVAAPVPGSAGRLASVAVSTGELAYVFGGYTVAEDGAEVSTPWTHSFDPVSGVFRDRAPMPVPVDDAVAVSYEQRYIYLISGWHDIGNVNLVQRYDTQTDTWVQATPIPGKAVFGHAGGIVGNRIVYCDGVAIRSHADKRRDYAANDECFIGIIDENDSRQIDWRTIDGHPGAARYRMAAAGVVERQSVMFVGGTDNPYNYNGIGYDGRPSEPVDDALVFNVNSLEWTTLSTVGTATMDHRGLVASDGGWLTVGGMLSGQIVTDRVVQYTFR
ncbi:MAG: galactose oxidase [Gammaproteobacteria bacterium]|nr:galactose oxidase [Gammaproteobacteria bacterium]